MIIKGGIFFLLVLISVLLKASPSRGDTSVPSPAYTPDFTAPPNAPYTAEEVKIKTLSGHTLAGSLTLPKQIAQPVAAVVTITGSSPQDRDHNTTDGYGGYRIFRQLADTLSRRGIAVLRMDDRGIGSSTGDFWSATTPDRADDIREGITYLRNRSEINRSQIMLVGLSEGGMIAPLVASTDTTLAGIVLMAGPASTGKEILTAQIRFRIAQDSTLLPKQQDSAFAAEQRYYMRLMEDLPWLRYFWSYNPATTALKVRKVPVLILQGTTDRNVPWAEARKLEEAFQQAGNANVTVHIFPNVNHLFLEDRDGSPEKYSLLPSFEVSSGILGIIVNWCLEVAR